MQQQIIQRVTHFLRLKGIAVLIAQRFGHQQLVTVPSKVRPGHVNIAIELHVHGLLCLLQGHSCRKKEKGWALMI